MSRLLPLLLLLSQGCIWITESQIDFDGDRYCPPGFEKFCPQPVADCDNSDPSVNSPTTYFADRDGDTFGDPDSTKDACEQPQGYVEDDQDCNDQAADQFPGALWYGDADGDGYGFGTASPTGCKVDDGDVNNNNDCNDLLADENPDVFWYPDEDGDGWGGAGGGQACERGSLANPVLQGGDCDDTNPTVYPHAEELCDGIDNSCQFTVDPNELDNDQDGYVECSDWVGAGAVAGGGDCDDTDEFVYPGHIEECDGLDNDCDGTLPDDEVDDDGDGWVECALLTRGWHGVAIDGGNDCDDTDDGTYPGSPERCDGLSNSCTNLPPEEIDDDGDGYVECVFDELFPWQGDPVTGDGDCDDNDDTVYPEAVELCDGQVNACGGELPANEKDEDGDGYVTCIIHGSGWDGAPIGGGQDCNDADPTVYPGAVELCDGQVNTCGGGLPLEEMDGDQDGFVDCSVDLAYWVGTPITGGDDCNDDDGTVYPGASEICDGQVNDCGNPLPGTELDGDVDGFVGCEVDVGGWDGEAVSGGGDCDDTDTRVYPGATELCDGRVNDCNNALDPIETDADGDQWVGCTLDPGGWFGVGILGDGDCNDNDDTVYPGATEVCDGQLNDCSGVLPVDETDGDLDGYVPCATDAGGWDGPPETGGDDCDDADPTENPGVTWHADVDGDGHGSPVNPSACERMALDDVPSGDDCSDFDPDNWLSCATCTDADNDGDYVDCDAYVSRSGPDCDDNDKNENLTVVWYADLDGDTYGDDNNVNICERLDPADVANGGDCDDADPDNWFGCASCDDADHDGWWIGCDAYTATPGPDCDDNDPLATPDTTWYVDDDGDGFGDPNDPGSVCLRPPGPVSTTNKDCDDLDPNNWDSCDTCLDRDGDGGFFGCDAYDAVMIEDCDDFDSDIGPFATERCNGLDDNCDGQLDLTEQDVDGDLYVACTFDLSGWFGDPTFGDGDCGPNAELIHPGAVELCDGIDNDCFAGPDDGLARTTWNADADGDGYGSATDTVDACAQPVGYLSDASDCDDSLGTVNPEHHEICSDGLDNDCDPASLDGSCLTVPAAGLTGATLAGANADTSLGIAMDVAPGAVPTLFMGAPDDDAVYGPWLPAPTDARVADGSFPQIALSAGMGAAVVTGDFDGDGRVELLAGGSGNTAELIDDPLGLPTPMACLTGLITGGSFAKLGDFDGTAGDEILVGVPLAGRATIVGWSDFPGYPTCLDPASLGADHTGTTLGYDVASVGDVDGDGFEDYAMTDIVTSQAVVVVGGAEYRISSSSQIHAVQGLGDLDGDGYDDLAVADGGAGSVIVYFGRPTWADAPLEFLDPQLDRFFRLAMTGSGPEDSGGIAAGDVDGDGFRDIVIGDPDVDRAFLIQGPVGIGDADIRNVATTIVGADPSDADGEADGFGHAIEVADFDNDGRDDIAIGVPYRGGVNPGGDGAAEVIVIFGASL